MKGGQVWLAYTLPNAQIHLAKQGPGVPAVPALVMLMSMCNQGWHHKLTPDAAVASKVFKFSLAL